MGPIEKFHAEVSRNILRLADQRAVLDVELKQLMAVLEILEPKKKRKHRAKNGHGKHGSPAAEAMAIADTGVQLDAELLAKATKQTMKNAGQTLGSLARIGKLVRVKPGQYRRKK